MKFSYDIYDNLKQSKIFLANPQKNYIGTIGNYEHLKITLNFSTMSEASFDVYEYVNEEYIQHYDKLQVKRLIEIQYLGWFQIVDVEEKQNDATKERYKTIQCLTLENELVGKRVDDINGVFKLYDPWETDKSLLHIFTRNTGWSIGHLDNELLSKFRTFSINSTQVYNGLTTDVSKSFECLFTFDTYERKINAYKLANIGDDTNIIISRKNILKDYIRESSADKIITKLRVLGESGIDIRAVNPTGMNYLVDLSYFMTNEWVSQGLVDAWNLYKVKYDSFISNYNTTLSLFKSQQAELTVLNAQLTDLNSLKKAQEQIRGSFIEAGIPPIGTPEYTLYLNAINSISSYIVQIKNKELEITNKQIQINNTRVLLDDIGEDLDQSSNFTPEQIAEMNLFITENEEYQDSTFSVTDTMTEEEITDMKLELMQNGVNELARASQPQYTVNISANNLFSIRDDGSPISFKKWREQCELGNMITIKYRDDYFTTARLISITMDFDKPEDIEFKFSDRSRFDSELYELASIIADAGRTATSLSLSKMGWDNASKLVNPVREFMNGSLNATLNEMTSNDNQEMLITKFGLQGRKWLPDQNKYSDYQVWLNNNTLMFTSDAWKSAKAGIGLFTNTDGEKFYGVLADIICGNMVLTSALNIVNENNSIKLDKDGAVFNNCDITINKGINSLYLNALDGIKLTRNGVSQFYIDGSGNVTLSGRLTVSSGINTININGSIGIEILKGTSRQFYIDTDGNAVFRGNITSGTILSDNYIVNTSGMKINLSDGTIDTKYFKVGVDGRVAITGGSININTESETTDVINLNYSGVSTSLTSSSLRIANTNSGKAVSLSNYTNNPRLSFTVSGIPVIQIDDQRIFMPNRDIVCSNLSCDTLNSATPITSSNYNNGVYLYPPQVHNHNTLYSSINHSHSEFSSIQIQISNLWGEINSLWAAIN